MTSDILVRQEVCACSRGETNPSSDKLNRKMGKGGGSGGENPSLGVGNEKNADSRAKRKVTLAELGEHRTPENAWMCYRVRLVILLSNHVTDLSV